MMLYYVNKKDTFLERNPNEAVAECRGRTRPRKQKKKKNDNTIHYFYRLKN